jgi:hypothetical protein
MHMALGLILCTEKKKIYRFWWHIPVIPTFRRMREKYYGFKDSLDLHSETLSQKTHLYFFFYYIL